MIVYASEDEPETPQFTEISWFNFRANQSSSQSQISVLKKGD